jgi:hypothetical protein
MVKGHLTEPEATAAEAVFMRRTNTANMWAELRALEENARLVGEAGPPDVPLHLFVSNRGSPLWTESLAAYARAAGATLERLDASHYPHLDMPERIARTTAEVIENAVGTP